MPISPSDPRYVAPDGPLDAPVVIIGEAPGSHEESQKRPFVGPSGKLLDEEILKRAGLRRRDVLVHNVIPVRPPNNKMHRLKEIGVDKQEEMEACRRVILSHPRKMVVCMGNTALEMMTGRRNIMSVRGSLLTGYANTPVFPMLHPAFIFRDWKLLFPTRADAKKLKEYLDNPDFDDEVRHLTIYGREIYRSLHTRSEESGPTKASEFIQLIEAANDTKELCFDIETFAGTITVVGIATSPTRAISIPLTIFDSHSEARIVAALADLFGNSSEKITQNGIYDASYLADVWGVEVRGMVWDTMLMHHCAYAELPHSLAFLTSIYTHLPFFKMMAKEADDADYQDAHWEYNALDVCATFSSKQRLLDELTYFKLLDFYWTYYVRLTRTLARIQRRGIPIDGAERDRIKERETSALEDIRARIGDIVGFELNVGSNKQMKDYLYGTLRLPEQRNRLKQTVTTDETALQTLRRKYTQYDEFLGLALDARGRQKMLSTYLKPFEDPDGRVRTSYNIAGSGRSKESVGGTETGRLSSGTNIYGRGTNLQNQPKWAREFYVPAPEWVFWQADLSAAESYVVAWDSGDEYMLSILTNHSLYRNGAPSALLYHEGVGSIIFGCPPAEIVGDMRDVAKRVGHAWNYGMGTGKLAEVVNNWIPGFPFSAKDAKRCYMSLDNALEGVIAWRQRTRGRVRGTRKLTNCFGRQRLFLGRLEDATYREAYAFIPQSTVGDALNLSLVALEEKWDGYLDREILGQVHDSIFGHCSRNSLDDVSKDVHEIMQRELPMTHDGLALRIPCEFKTGANWREVS